MAVTTPPRPVGDVRPSPARLRHPMRAAVAAAVIGIVATAAGAGVGGRYAVKTGLSLTSAAGLVLLAAGLVLLVLAWRLAWRGLRRWRRLWLVPTTLLALLVLVSLALGTMYGVVAPRTSLGSATPADAGLAYTDVTVRTSDGVLLSAWCVPSRNSAAVLLLPGAGSTRTATLAQAAVLAGHGYGVLMVDPRGQGRSGGRGMDIGWYGDRDVGAAASFLRSRPDVEPAKVAALGLSMGGEEVIGAAATEAGLRAVVAEGATARTAADKAGWLPHGVAGALQRGIDRLTYGTTDVITAAPRPVPLHTAIARAEDTTFLLVTAGTMPDEARAAGYFRSAAPQRVRTWDVAGASHTGGLATSPADWSIRVLGFLDSALAIPGG